MNREIAFNLVAIDSLFCTALCQVNLCIDQRYVAISKWLHDCLAERRVCETPDIESYDVTIGMTSTPPEAIEDHIANPSEFEEEERYTGDTVEILIERYRKLTVMELKANLRQVGIKPRGLKKDLVRLLAEKEYQRLYSEWEDRREEAIRRKEQERIERIRDENRQLKEMTPEKKVVSVLSPLKSPVSVRLILTPRKAGIKPSTEEGASSGHQVAVNASADCLKGVHTPVKRDRGGDGMDGVPKKKADRKGESVAVASCELNREGEVASVKGVATPVKVEEVVSSVKVEVSSPVNEVASPVKVEGVVSSVKVEGIATLVNEVACPAKAEMSSPVKAKASSPMKVESSSPAKVEASSPAKVEASSPVKIAASSPVKVEASSPVKVEASSPVRVETPSTNHSSSTKETGDHMITPSIPQPESISTPSQSVLEHTTPNKVPSKKPLVSISTTPLHGLPVLHTSSSMVKDTESNGSRGSGNESIQAKTQLLLQRVEGMKKRKEERLQHSVLMTPGKSIDPLKMRPKMPSRGLAGLSSLKGGITLDEDLSMPALPAVADTMERSFISIVSSPAAQRKHAQSVSRDTNKKQKEDLPPKRTIPTGARRVPVQKAPPDVQKTQSDVPKPHSDIKPQPSQVNDSKPRPEISKPPSSQPNAPKPQPSQPDISTHTEAPAPLDTSKKRALPTQTKTDPEPKRPAVEPPKLPSNRSRPGSNATSTLPESTPNLEVLRQLVDSEKVDPAKRWYEEGNIDILLRRQYYESFTNGITAGLVFAPSDEIRLEQVLPTAPADHFERRPSDVWN